MAKVIWKQASKDSPIYTGRFIISSHNKRRSTRSDKSAEKATANKKDDKNNAQS